jgi:RimJ/RimL family protein N-acetyltransferase
MTWDIRALRELTLENAVVRLRRIVLDDRPGFGEIAFDPEIWTYFVARITDEQSLNVFMEQAVHDGLAGTRIVFAIIERSSGKIAGSTAFGNLAPAERRLEIGWSWLGAKYRGTQINRATKGLLLDYAFTTLECERVEFKTDVLNVRACKGLEAVGAKREGTLRSFNYMPGGRRRDAVYYSILKSEWPAVRKERFAQERPATECAAGAVA